MSPYIDYALKTKKYKMGFIASGDHNSMGIGLAALWVKEVSRAGIIEALREIRPRRGGQGQQDRLQAVHHLGLTPSPKLLAKGIHSLTKGFIVLIGDIQCPRQGTDFNRLIVPTGQHSHDSFRISFRHDKKVKSKK